MRLALSGVAVERLEMVEVKVEWTEAVDLAGVVDQIVALAKLPGLAQVSPIQADQLWEIEALASLS